MVKMNKILPILIIGFVIFGATKILAQTQEPIISLACEGKSGILSGVNDGWSNKNTCTGKDQRLVRLGNLGPNGIGNILFIFRPPGDPIFVLTTDGKIYKQSQDQGWISAADATFPGSLPAEVPPTSVAQWMVVHLLDKDGNVWWWDRTNQTWKNIGHP